MSDRLPQISNERMAQILKTSGVDLRVDADGQGVHAVDVNVAHVKTHDEQQSILIELMKKFEQVGLNGAGATEANKDHIQLQFNGQDPQAIKAAVSIIFSIDAAQLQTRPFDAPYPQKRGQTR